MKPKNRLLFSSLIIVAFASQLHAANRTWTTGDGGNGLWSNTANWGGTVPVANDNLIFGVTAGTTTLNYDLALTQFGTFTFDALAPAYTIGGNDFNGFGPAGFVVNSASNITQTINLNFTASANAIPVTGAGNLLLTGKLIKGGTYNPFLQMNGTGVLTIGGSGTLNTAGGTSPLTANSGTVVLARTYASGGFNVGLAINGGTVKLGAAEQLRTGQGPIINGGTLDLNGYDNAQGGNGALVANSGGTQTGGMSQLTGLGGRVTNNAAGTGTNYLIINGSNNQASYGGTITDGAAKVGVSVFQNYNQINFQAFSGNNTYSGGTFIQHGYTGSGGRPVTLSIANVASLGSAGYRNLTFKAGASSADVVLQLTGTAVTNSNQFDGITFTSGLGAGFDIADPNNTFTLGKNAGGLTDIAFTGGGVFEKLGAGTLTITSGALAYTGGTYLGGGTLKIDAQNGGALPSGSVITFAGGNLYYQGKSSGTTTQTLGSIGLAQLNNYGANSGGAGMITVDANGGGGTTVNFNGLPISTNAGYSLNIKTLTGGTVTTTTTATAGGTTAGNGMVGTGRIVFTDASNNVDFAGISGSGTNRTIQAATYTAGLPASGSSSTLAYSQQNGASVTTSESVYALKLTTNTGSQSLAITSGQTLTLTSGGLLFTGGNDYSITDGTLKSNTATNSDLIVHQYGTGNLTIGSVIANGVGASTLTKAGPGTLTLSGANTYTGSTYVTGGILSISSDNNIGGYNGTFANLTSTSGNSAVTSSAASLPAGFGVGSTMLGRTVNAIGGTSGAYTITLSGGANTTLAAGTASWVSATPTLYLYSGGVLQANGTFSLQESNAGGTAGTTTVNRGVTIGNSGGGFDVTGANTLTITGGIGATGMMTKSGTGTLTLSAANNLTGGITITDGTLKLNIANALTANSGTATSNLIFGAGTAPKLQLNNYDAAVTSLVSSNANAIVENGVAGTKTLTVSNGADNTYAGKLQNGSAGVLALAKSGGGTLTLNNASNAFSGGLTIYNGTVEGTQAGTLGTGTITLADGTLKATGTFTNAITSWASVAGSATNAVSYLNNTIDTSGGNASFSGVFSGSGALNKTGANTLTLSNASNTFSGILTATSGTISFASIGAGATLSMGGGNFTATASKTVAAIALGSSGTLATGNAILNANSLTGSGTLTLSSNGSWGNGLRLSGVSNTPEFSGSINITKSTGNYAFLYLANEDLLGSNTDALSFGPGGLLSDNGSPLTIANHRINLTTGGSVTFIQGNSTGDMSITGGITGSGSIAIRSEATGKAVVIGGVNDYTGGTTLYNDTGATTTLRLAADNALPYGIGKGNLTFTATNGGSVMTLLDMGGYDLTVNGVSSNNASAKFDNVSAGGNVTLTVGANNANGNTFYGVIQNTTGTLNLTKTGTGTQTLSGTNTYTGATTVEGGKLLINGNISTSTTTVKTTGTLGGSGTSGAVIVESGGKIAPGNSIGTLTSAGNVTFNAGSVFEVEIDTASSYDKLGLNLGGDLNITSGAKLDLIDFGSPDLIALNARLQLIDYSSVGGTWNGGLFTFGTEELSDSETFAWQSNTWLINYDDTLGAGDTSLSDGGSYVTLTVVPEPNVAALVGGLGVLALLRRRR